MPPKGRKKRNNQLASAINAAAAEGESPNVANDEEKKKSSNKSMGCDIFSDSAMENAYYTCHNIQVTRITTAITLLK